MKNYHSIESERIRKRRLRRFKRRYSFSPRTNQNDQFEWHFWPWRCLCWLCSPKYRGYHERKDRQRGRIECFEALRYQFPER